MYRGLVEKHVIDIWGIMCKHVHVCIDDGCYVNFVPYALITETRCDASTRQGNTCMTSSIDVYTLQVSREMWSAFCGLQMTHDVSTCLM
jgi:hypothetical protein